VLFAFIAAVAIHRPLPQRTSRSSRSRREAGGAA
jgi:hypothetical protein